MRTNKFIKIILLAMVITAMAFMARAQSITIAGKLQPGKYDGLALTNPEKGVNIPVQLSPDNTFKVTIPTLTKGYYTLGSLTLYLEPGFNLQLNPEDKTYAFSGKGAAENNVLSGLVEMRRKYLNRSPDKFYYSSVNISLDSMLHMTERYKTAVNASVATITNPYFKKLYLSEQDSYRRYTLGDFNKNYGIDSVVVEQLNGLATSKYYTDQVDMMKVMMMCSFALYQNWLTDAEKVRINQQLSDGFDWNNEELYLNSATYRDELMGKIAWVNEQKGNKKITNEPGLYTDQIKVIDENITNPVIKDRMKVPLGSMYLKIEKNDNRIDSMYRVLAALKLPADQREGLETQYKNSKILKTDPESINFSYKDINDKTVQLKELRGKYVYIDVWATWCAPCKAEIPHLVKIEEEYKDKNITFVSLSVDRKADKGKWQDMVKDMHLTGIQIIADKDFSSDFVQIFQIASIPRFILIAPDGKIVSADASRPSDPKLKEQLNKLL